MSWVSASGNSYARIKNKLKDDSVGGNDGRHIIYYPPLASEIGVVNYEYNYMDGKRFGIVGDGVTDISSKLQNAIDSIANAGGGGLVIEYERSGFYLGSGVTVKKGVYLMGVGPSVNGAYLSDAVAGNGMFVRSYFILDSIIKGMVGFTVEDSAGIENFGFYYKSVDTQITSGIPPEFGWTIQAAGFGYSLKNLSTMGASYFINAESAERCNIENISGLITRVGLRVRRSRDISRIDGVHFNPNITYPYVDGSSSEGFSTYFVDWMKSNSTAIRYGSADIHFVGKVLTYGHKFGIHVVPNNHQDYYDDGSTALGQQFDSYSSAISAESIVIDACKFPIYVERDIGFTNKIGNCDIVPINDDGGGVGITMTGGCTGLLQITNLLSKGSVGKTSQHIVIDSAGVSLVDVINARYINPGNDALINDVSNMFTVTGDNRLSTGISFSKTNAVGVYRHIQYASDAIIFPQGVQVGSFSIEGNGSDSIDFIARDGADVKQKLISIDKAGGIKGRSATIADDGYQTFDVRTVSNTNGRAIIFVSADFPGDSSVIAYIQGTELYPINVGANSAANSVNPDIDGKLNVYISSPGVIGIRNRLGSARPVSVSIFSSV